MIAPSQKTILLVEDDYVMAMTGKKSLEKYGYKTFNASSGEEAIDIFKNNVDVINLILMDIDLGSGIDGTETAAIILKDHDVPVVFLSSHTETEIVEKTEKITSYGYVVKGTGITVLDASIKMAFKLFDSRKKEIEKERALQESEQKYRNIYDNSLEGIYRISLDGKIIHANKAMASILGYDSPSELIDTITNAATQIWLDPKELSNIISIIEKQNVLTFYECQFKRKDARNIWVSLNTRAVRDNDHNIIYFDGFIEDITERKRAEKALQLTCERLTEAQKTAKIGDWEADLLTGELYWSQVIFDIFGLDSKSFKPSVTAFYNAVHPDDREMVHESENRSEKTGLHDVIHRITRPDGEIRFVHELAKRYEDNNGKLIMLRGTVNDITERMLAENKLRESEEKYRLLHENAGIGIGYYNLNGIVISFNRLAASNMNGFPEDFIGKSIYDLFQKQEADIFYDRIQKAALSRELNVYEEFVNLPSGNKCFMSIYTKITDSHDNILGIQVISQNITERKKMEDSLRNSEELFKCVVQNSSGLTMLTDETGKVTYISPQCEIILGYPSEKFVGQVMPDIIHPDDVAMCQNAFDRVFLHGQKVSELEYRIIDSDNNVRWISHNANAFKFNERFSGIHSSIRDITERKIMEEKLRESENNYRTLTDCGQALIWTSGTDKLCNYFNRVWLEFTGRTFEQEYGNGWAEGLHPDDFQHCLGVYTGSFDRREKFSMEYRLRRHDGEYRWLLDEGSPRYNIKGEFIGYIGHCFDITERKIAEEKIKTLLLEKEIILKEAHHRIKNNMNTVSSIMCLQLETLKEPSAIAAVEDARSRVHSMMVLYDKLYRSDDFKDLSFKKYITPLIDEIIDNFPNKGIVKTEKVIDDFIIDAKKLPPLGIIVNEILTNIMKYAFKGRDNALIKVTAAISDNRVTVTVADNGIGIPESIDIATSTGFGLQLVDIMTQALRGKMKIERGNGTKFILEFNLSK